MGAAAASLADVAIATSDNRAPRIPSASSTRSSRDGEPPALSPCGPARAIAQALELARLGDTVLLAGKGHETYQVVGTVKQPFDEREIVRELGAQ